MGSANIFLAILFVIILIILVISIVYFLFKKKGFPKLKEYEFLDVLGRGGFGVAYRARHRSSGQIVAIKKVERDPWNREGELMRRFPHPNIVKIFREVHNEFYTFIIMEYMSGGTLESRLKEKGPFTESLTKLYFLQMCQAINCLHENGLTHRDLKPENMLLACQNDETLLKISDFGLSDCCFNWMATRAGTEGFMAPEVLSGQKYGLKCDIFSLGITLICCLSGKYPKNQKAQDFKDEFNWNGVSGDLKDLIDCMLKSDPDCRWNVEKVLGSSWLNDQKVEKTLGILRKKFDPN